MVARDFQAVTTLADLDSLLAEVQRDPDRLVAFDVETGYSTPKPVDKRALDIYHPDFFVVGFSITTDSSWARYVPLRHDVEQYFDPKEVWEKFRPVFEQQIILAHHKKFEDKVLRALHTQGDAYSEIITRAGHDSMIAAYVSGQFKESGLKHLTKVVLGEEQATFASLFDAPDGTPAKPAVVKRSRFNGLNPTTPSVVSYACDDAALCLDLHNVLQAQLTDDQRRVYAMEMGISALMVEAEQFGVGVTWSDMAEAKKQGASFRPTYDTVVREHLGKMSNDPRIKEKAKTVNFGSALQMRTLLYDDFGLTTTRTTPKGEFSTDAQALEALSRRHVGIRGLLAYRETGVMSKRLDKWLEEYSGARDGRAHASFAQTRVITGRFSANDPAIQQLPKYWLWSVEVDEEFNPIKKGENGVEHWEGNFREFIAAKDEHYLLTFDYSQLELRVIAGITQDPTLLNAFASGVDPHTATGAMMLGIPVDQVGKKERAIGKTCIAAGELVTTDRGLVPIEAVLPSDKVWDGSAWVSHDGVVYQGVREVITAHGLSATPDHKVVMSDGSTVCWGYASTRGDFAAAGDSGAPSVVSLPAGRYVHGRQAPEVRGGVLTVRQGVREIRGEHALGQGSDVRVSAGCEVSRSTGEDSLGAVRRDGRKMSSGIFHGEELRGSRDTQPVRVSRAFHLVGAGESATPDVQGRGHRQNGQRRTLRAGESSSAVAVGESRQQAGDHFCAVHGYAGCPSSRVALVEDRQARVPVQSEMDSASAAAGALPAGVADDAAQWSWAPVYDVTNAGPRHRFVVSGRVVLNCNFAILYGQGPKSMAERLAMSVEEARAMMDTYKSQFQNIASWDSAQRAKGVRQKYVTTWLGRTVPLFQAWSDKPGLVAQAERLSVNAPVQGGGADYVKLAMLRSKSILQSAGLWGPGKVMMTMNQHDSLTFEAHNSIDPNYLRSLLQQAVVFDAQAMFPDMAVPKFPAFEVDWEIGLTWGGSRGWEDEAVVWDAEHQQWRFADFEPFHRPNTSAHVLAEPEQVVLTLEGLPDPEEAVEDAPAIEESEDGEEKILHIYLPYEMSMANVDKLEGLLEATPGDRAVEMSYESKDPIDGTLRPQKFTMPPRTCLTVDDADRIRLALPDAVLS